MCLIKPDHFACAGMAFYNLTTLARTQLILSNPLKFHLRFATIGFNYRPTGRLENFLPGKVQSSAVVADIQQTFAHKTFSNLRRNRVVNLSAVSYWCLAALFGNLQRKEPQLHWPTSRIGILIVQWYRLMCRVFGR